MRLLAAPRRDIAGNRDPWWRLRGCKGPRRTLRLPVIQLRLALSFALGWVASILTTFSRYSLPTARTSHSVTIFGRLSTGYVAGGTHQTVTNCFDSEIRDVSWVEIIS